MEKYMNDILNKTEELIDSIKNSSNYKKYLKLKDRMISNTEIMSLISDIKCIQKEVVKLKSKNETTFELEKQIKTNLDKLNNIPLYVEYDYVQTELNKLLQQIKNTIELCINDITK